MPRIYTLFLVFTALYLVSCTAGDDELQAEIARLRRLAAAGDVAALADMIDHSMVTIPAGDFTMGSPSGPADEQPQRQIYLDAFSIDRYEVTNAQYQRFALATGARTPEHWVGVDYPPWQADWPVTGVSWKEAMSYCTWASKRLPSEAEWEKACRGPQASIYPWGNTWNPDLTNTGSDRSMLWPPSVEAIWLLLLAPPGGAVGPHPQPVGSYPQGASAYGVLDLAGNASEWVLDWYSWQGYENLPLHNPVGVSPLWNHSLRGSGWVDRDGEQERVADLSRCARRNSAHTSNDPRLGFRCAVGGNR